MTTADRFMSSWIEFHDSELISAARSDLEVSILLDAYIHRWDDGDRRRGTGWMQQVRLIVGRAVGSLPTLAAPASIADGQIRIGPVLHGNLVPMPIQSEEPVSLKIQLVTGEILEVSGQAVRSESIGEARYLEDLATDLWPEHSV
jgi:hypothetical protein